VTKPLESLRLVMYSAPKKKPRHPSNVEAEAAPLLAVHPRTDGPGDVDA
jgi:hypothetical protein